MTKIKLPRAITEAIEDLRVEGYTDTQIVYGVESGKGNHTLNDYFFDIGTPDELMQALVIGYESDESTIVTVEHFGALNLLAHHYDVLAGLIANYTSVELDDLVKNGYRTK